MFAPLRAQTATAPSGAGTEASPYQITSLEELYWLSQNPAEWDKYYQQTADINASETSAWDDGDGGDPEGFSPIGNTTNNFSGSYDGGGYTITGLFINRPSSDNIGLFGYMENATISNLGLLNVDITGYDNTGGLAGQVSYGSSVSNAFVTGSVSGHDYTGGLSGGNNGTITDSYSSVSVSGANNTGGLVGDNAGNITYSYAEGEVSGTSFVGGLVGYYGGGGLIANTYANGNTSGTGNAVGGLVGFNEGSQAIQTSYATGHVSGDSNAGGLIGENYGTLSNCYWDTETSGTSTGIGQNNQPSQTAAGLTSDQMKLQSNFSGFDFDATWKMYSNFTEPFLQSNPPDSVNGIELDSFTPPAGSGTSEDPYLISDLNDLQLLSQYPGLWSLHFKQTDDIDASETSGWDDGAGFSPIGNDSIPFTGIYNGDGYTISRLTINRPSTTYIGLFGYADSASITHVGLSNVSVTGTVPTGGLAGAIYATTINRSFVTGTVTGEGQTGGLAGQMNGNISSISGSYTSGTVTGAFRTGGLAGVVNAGSISESWSDADVTGGNQSGGLIGYLNSGNTLTNSYFTGSMSGGDEVGGLVGYSQGSVTNSYTDGSISGTGDAGALIGRGASGSTVSGGYWNTDTAGVPDAIGENNSGQSATGLITAEMKQQDSFPAFDFTTDWRIFSGFTRPFLQALPPDSVNGIPVAEYVPSGSGTSESPYLIASLENLYWLSQSDSLWDANLYFRQTADIDASETIAWDDGAGFSPIGNGDGSGNTVSFEGTYNGDGHTISGLFINRPSTGYVGLFGYAKNATFTDLGLTGVDITGYIEVGGLAGTLSGGLVSGSYVTGTVKGTGYKSVGGLIGLNTATVSNSYSEGTVSGGTGTDVGGLIGVNGATVSNSHSAAEVSGGSQTGGLIGSNYNSVTGSYATGTVSGTSAVGGLMGTSQGVAISGNYATGSVTGTGTQIGGLVGYLVGDLSDSYATGSVSGNNQVGGLAGINEGNAVTDSYATGSVSGSSQTGGFIGYNEGSGTVSGGYWNTETSGQANAFGTDENSQSAAGLTTAEMKRRTSFSGFDFEDTWGIYSGLTHPWLQANHPDAMDGIAVEGYLSVPSGSGTESDPYLISTLDELYWLSQSDSLWDANLYFRQTADIDAFETIAWDDSAGFTPIGNSTTYFTGSYDGDGHTIAGLVINRPSTSEVGLFGVTENAAISDLGLTAIDISSQNTAGGFAGFFGDGSTLSGSYTTGTVNGGDDVGGLAGFSLGLISGCYSTANVSGGSFVGGLAGENYNVISQSYATGDVSGVDEIGGLVGYLAADLSDSYATGSVTASNRAAGGLTGSNNGSISNSYATGSAGAPSSAGGLIGQNDGTLSGGYWDTETSGLSTGIGTDNNAQTVTGLSSAEMMQKSSFTTFDFDSTWSILTGLTRPWLQNLAPDSINGIAADNYQSPDGSGTESDPYQIATLKNLRWMSLASSVWDAYYLQTTDIDASETIAWDDSAGFTPIGNTTTSFTGTYNGDGHTISGLFINRPSTGYVGLFGNIAGEVTGLGLININITGGNNTGGLAGGVDLTATLSNSYTTGSVSGTDNGTGGLAGLNAGTVSGSYSTARVSGSESVGGLIGNNFESILTHSYASGRVTGVAWTGGLIGRNDVGSITNSYATGSVSGTFGIGGLIGENEDGTISGSYWNTTLSGISTGIGTDNNGQTATGLTAGEMIDPANLDGWDFSSDTLWAIDEGFTFPYLPNTGGHRFVVATIDGDEGWRMIGNTGDVTYGELLDPIWTQGYEGSDAGTGFSSNVYFYEESSQSWTAPSSASDYFGTADSTTENTALNGILLYVYADDDNDGTDDSWPKYLAAENSNLNESYELSLSYTNSGVADSSGWNLVSNPYPVSLDWEEVVGNGDSQNTLPIAYIWDGSLNGGYGGYKVNFGYPLPPGAPDDFFFDGPIPAIQSFWVKATAEDASLGFKPEYQSGSEMLYKTSPADEPGSEPVEPSWLHLSVQHGDFSDQVTLFSGEEEGKKINVPKLGTLASRYIEFALSDSSSKWISRSVPEIETGTTYTYPLELSTTETGTYTLNWQGLDSFGSDWQFTLTDHQTRKDIVLREGSTYEFEIDAGTLSKTRSEAEHQNEGTGGTQSETKSLHNQKPAGASALTQSTGASELASNEDNELPLPGRGFPEGMPRQRGGLNVSKATLTASKTSGETTGTRFTLSVTKGTSVSNEPGDNLPKTFDLAQNYPNPFNPSTVIKYQLPVNSRVQLQVYDILGRLVATLVDGERKAAGTYNVTFDARSLASGMYIYRLVAGNNVFTKKLTLIK